MDLSSIDIRNQLFRRKNWGGIDPEEVSAFLAQVALAYETKTRELQETTDKLGHAKVQLEHYRGLEQVLQETAITLQRTLEEKTAQANREAEIIIAEAKAKAWQETEGIRREGEKLRSELDSLRQQRTHFFVRMKQLVLSQGELLAAMEEDSAPQEPFDFP